MLWTLDQVAKRYSKWPHEILDLEPWQEALAVLCLANAQLRTAENVQRASAGGMVFPVINLGA